MLKGTSRRGLIVLGALCLAFAPAAEAAKRPPTGKIRTGRATAQIPGVQGEFRSATAICPAGTRAVSGGFSTSPVPNELVVTSSHRASRRSWTATVQQTTTNAAPAVLTTFVYCDRRLRRATAVRAELAIPATDTATATCPANRRAISGGFSTPVSTGFAGAGAPLASRRTAPGAWSVTLININGPHTDLTAYAYCTRRSGRLRERTGTGTLPAYMGDSPTATAASSRCPKRVTARSGGFAIDTNGNNIAVFESRRVGRRWVFSTRNFGSPAAPLTSFAYCS